ncbi:hypothetical protein [Mucilaginibacter sp.]|uniref:hypothetical protein n=1 Tax=Mucilaginibacter sp. TaxID=1882438 RepID=UPI003439045B
MAEVWSKSSGDPKGLYSIQVTGHREETDNLITILEPYGLIEFVRSARVAIIKSSDGFNTKLKQFEKLDPLTDMVPEDFLNEVTTGEIIV